MPYADDVGGMKRDDEGDQRLTAQRREIGQRLRELRERAGFSSGKLGEILGVDQSTISRWETGKRKIGTVDLTRFMVKCGASQEEIRELTEMLTVRLVAEVDEEVWTSASPTDRSRLINALFRAEENAQRITYVAGLVVPGLFQTADYIRHIMERDNIPSSDVLARVRERVGRREIITRRNKPVHVDAFIDEAVIRRGTGGPRVMHEQLGYLLDLAQLPNVNLRLVPLAADWGPTHEGQWVIIDLLDQESLVNQETRGRIFIFNDAETLELYRQAVPTVEKMAMSPADSQGLIAERQSELETQL